MIIRNLKRKDIKHIARVHINSLPNTTSSKIGLKYLEKSYEIFVRKDNIHKGYVAQINSKVIGVITATTNLKYTQTQLRNLFFPKKEEMK